MLLIGIRTDDDLGRADVEFYTGAHSADLTRAPVVRTGSESARAQLGTAEIDVDGTTLSLTVDRSLLDDPEEIAVAVAAGREYADEDAAHAGGDEAPATGASATRSPTTARRRGFGPCSWAGSQPPRSLRRPSS